MSIELECLACGRNLRVRDELAGRKVRCPGCGKVMPVPAVVEELPVVGEEEELPEEEEESPARPARRRLPKRRQEREMNWSWLPQLGIAVLFYALGTVCLIIAINSDFYQILIACILFWILGTFTIMRMFGWSPY
jgi:hypothetical protein